MQALIEKQVRKEKEPQLRKGSLNDAAKGQRKNSNNASSHVLSSPVAIEDVLATASKGKDLKKMLSASEYVEPFQLEHLVGNGENSGSVESRQQTVTPL